MFHSTYGRYVMVGDDAFVSYFEALNIAMKVRDYIGLDGQRKGPTDDRYRD